MADLAKVGKKIDQRGQPTRNRDALIPQRRNTQTPDLEVNARILRPNAGSAEELRRALNLVQDTAANIGALGTEKQLKRDAEAAGQAAIDFSSGEQNPEMFARVAAYRRAWSIEGAKSMAVDIDIEASEAASARLTDEDNPATLDDLSELLDDLYKKKALGEDGKPLDFGDPKAQRILANQMMETRARIMGRAAEVIKTRTDTKIISTIVHNVFVEGVDQKPIGADLETGEDPSGVSTAAPPKAVSVAPTGRPPIPGKVTQSQAQHRARGSAGVDIDGKRGDPVQAPASGTITEIGRDSTSGNFVVIDHGNGVVSTYSHLNKVTAKKGQIVPAGTAFAEVGNTGRVSKRTGDGSHLHWRVKVAGKDVDPLSYKFPAGSLPVGQTASVEGSTVTPAPVYPSINFEEAMGRVPPGIDRGFAKKMMLQGFLNLAQERGDARLLDSLITSTRKDGTPSFTPDEIATIQDQRSQIKSLAERQAEASRKDRWAKSADQILTLFVDGGRPSMATIRDMVRNDQLDPSFAFSIANHMDAEDRRIANEADAASREAEYREDQETSMVVASEAALLRVGAIEGTSPESLTRRFQNGEWGMGKKAVAHYNTLRAARKEGEAAALADPDAALWASKLKRNYGTDNPTRSRVARSMGVGSNATVLFPAMLAEYEAAIRRGEKPSQAYLSAVAKYGPKDRPETGDARKARIRLLEQRLTSGR